MSGGTKSADVTDADVAGEAGAATETITFPAGSYSSGSYLVRVVNSSNFSARSNGVCDGIRASPYIVEASIGGTPLTVSATNGPTGLVNFRDFDASFGDGFYGTIVP